MRTREEIEKKIKELEIKSLTMFAGTFEGEYVVSDIVSAQVYVAALRWVLGGEK